MVVYFIGNILVSFSPKGEPSLIFLDCGIVYHSRSEKDHEKLVAICKAFMMHDGRSAARFMIDVRPSYIFVALCCIFVSSTLSNCYCVLVFYQ